MSVAPPAGLQATAPPKPPAVDTSARDAAAAVPSSAALFTKQSPVLDVRTIGPRKIMVGRESTYEVVIRNSGQVAADEVSVTVDLPDWADVQASEPSAGLSRRMPGFPPASGCSGKWDGWKAEGRRSSR